MKKTVVIRNAVKDDAQGIHSIALANAINSEKSFQKGFITYPLSVEEYAHRIHLSKHFYVAETAREYQGFLMCYDSNELQNILESSKYEAGIISKICSYKTPFILGDQIVVKDKRTNVGTGLLTKLFSDMSNEGVYDLYVAVRSNPTNIASEKFCDSLGFKNVDRAMNGDGTLWAIKHYALSPEEIIKVKQ